VNNRVRRVDARAGVITTVAGNGDGNKIHIVAVVDMNMRLCQDLGMRTTIDIPDPTFRELKTYTAERGMSMKEFVLRAVQDQFARLRQESKRRHSVKLPLIPSKLTGTIPSMTNADIEDLLD
jgi:hypothetical protein